jgi:hypothetical protein
VPARVDSCLLFAVCGAFAALSPSAAAQVSHSCDTSSEGALGTLAYLRALVSYPEESDGRQITGVSLQDSTTVVLVSDARSCSRAADAINAWRKTPGVSRRIGLVKIGKRDGYAVYASWLQPPPNVLGYGALPFLTSSFRFRLSLAH